jgi:hypothetical protein
VITKRSTFSQRSCSTTFLAEGPTEPTDPSGDQARIIHLRRKHQGTYMLEGVAHASGFGRTDIDDVLPGAPGTNAALQQRGSDTGADDDTE